MQLGQGSSHFEASMDARLFETLGRIAGIGGIALGVFLLLFRNVIRKNIFPTLTDQNAFRLIRQFLYLTFGIAALGIGAWVFVSVFATADSKKQAAEPTNLSVAEKQAKELVAQVSGTIRGAWENSDRSPEDHRKVVENAPKAANSLLLLNDHDLKPAWQIVKYEYAQEAFGMSASVWPNTNKTSRLTKKGYGEECLKAGQKALDIMGEAQAKYGQDKEFTEAWDFALEEDEQDRVRYFMAICCCRLADVEKNTKLRAQAQQWIDRIGEQFIAKWPIKGNDEFTGCIRRP
jgi:hypothetical protein